MAALNKVCGAWTFVVSMAVVVAGLLRPSNALSRLGRCLTAVLAVLIGAAMPGVSWASPGCEAINANAGYFNFDYPLLVGTRKSGDVVGLKRFDAGDRISFTYTRLTTSGVAFSSVSDPNTGFNENILYSGNPGGIVNYTLRSSFTDGNFSVGNVAIGTIRISSIRCVSIVPPDPVVVSIAPDSGREGMSVTITGTDFVSGRPYEADFGGATAAATFVNATTLTTTAPAHAVGTTSVIVTDTSTSTVLAGRPTFTYVAQPVVTSNPSDTSASTGGTTTFTAAALGWTSVKWQESTDESGATYADIADGGGYAGATTGSLTVTGRMGLDQRYYRAVFSNADGQATSYAGRLVVIPTAPTISATLSPSTIEVGGSAILTLSMSNPNDKAMNGVFGQSGNANNLNYSLPPGVTATSDGTIDCGGVSSFYAGSSEGQPIWTQVPADSAATCTLTLPVTSAEAGEKPFADIGYALFFTDQSSVTGSIAVAGGTLMVTAGPATALQVVAESSKANVGRSRVNLTVTAFDAHGNAATGYSGTVRFTSSDRAATLPADITLTNGVGTATIIFGTVGDQSVTVTDTVTSSLTDSTDVISVVRGGQKISFTSTAPDPATVGGATYSVTAEATSGLPVVFAIDATSSGVCTIAGGVVSFIGTGTCTITADQAGDGSYDPAEQYQQSFEVTVANLTITSAEATGAKVGEAFSQANPAQGGRAPYEYVLASGVLPAGTTLNPSTGLVSGTLTTVGGYTYSIQVTDSAEKPATVVGEEVSRTIGKGDQKMSFDTRAPGSVIVGGATYGVSATATSGLPVSLTVDSGSNAVCSISEGVISFTGVGICTINADQAGSSNYNAARRAQQSITVGVTGPTLADVSPDSGPVFGGTAVTLTGADLAGATVTVDGVSVTPTASSATTLSFVTPAHAAGVVPVVVTTGEGRASISFTYVAAPVSLTPASLPNGTVGVAYSQALSASGGTAPYSYVVAAGALPAGLSLSPAGVLSGTPTVGETASFSIAVTDAQGATDVGTYDLTVIAQAPMVAAVSADVAYNSTGQAISLTATGVYTALSVEAAPRHGAVTISGATATYVPATGYFGTDSFTYLATGPGGISTPATVTLTVAPPPPPVVTPPVPTTMTMPNLPSGAPGFLTVELATFTSGTVTSFEIAVQAQHGLAVIEVVPLSLPMALQLSGGSIYRLRYTPAPGFMGVDTVSLVAVGPGGRSAPAVFTFNVAGQAPNLSAQVVSNGSVTLRPTDGLTGGPFQAVRITRQPTFGTAEVRGLEIVFTPGLRNAGATSLEYVVDLPFGTSAAGRVDLISNAAPSAQALTARTPAGRPVTVRLTDGALGGPFTGAAVTGITPAGSATATLVQGGTTAAPIWDLTFAPQGTFTGEAVVHFTLTNAFATTAGTLTVTVDPRPDPSHDQDVRGVISSQVASARRFADAQTDNFNRRLEQIRHGRSGDSNMLNLNAGFASGTSMLDPQAQLRRQLRGADQTFGDEALRVRLGLHDPSGDERLNRRNGSIDPFAVPATNREAVAPVRPLGAADQGRDAQPSNIAVWAAGGIDWGRRDVSTGARDYRFTTSGVSAGSDVRLTDSLVVGLGAGYGLDRTRVGTAESQSEGRSVVVAAYGGWQVGSALNVSGVIGYGDLSFDSRRWATAAQAGQGDWAVGQRKGDMLFGSFSLASDQDLSWVRRSVYARLEAQSVTLDAFTERGADIHALSYQALDFNNLSTTVGLKYDWRIERRDSVLTPSVRLEWTHAFDHAGSQTMTYADWLTSPLYGLSLDNWDRDTLEVWLEGGWRIGDRVDVSAGYRAALGNNTASQGLQLKLMTRF